MSYFSYFWLHQLHHSRIVFFCELQATFRTLIIISLRQKKWKIEKPVQIFCVPFRIQTSRTRKGSHSIKCLFVPWRKFGVWKTEKKYWIRIIRHREDISPASTTRCVSAISGLVCRWYPCRSTACAAQCRIVRGHVFSGKVWNFKEHRIYCGSENLTKY